MVSTIEQNQFTEALPRLSAYMIAVESMLAMRQEKWRFDSILGNRTSFLS
ncbi:MAG: hypothetical protein FD137_2541 [Spirochaetes bacterium]|nr:MAG: hypothetical protein FD137_2541 [Spirochaetota bacterium]